MYKLKMVASDHVSKELQDDWIYPAAFCQGSLGLDQKSFILMVHISLWFNFVKSLH